MIPEIGQFALILEHQHRPPLAAGELLGDLVGLLRRWIVIGAPLHDCSRQKQKLGLGSTCLLLGVLWGGAFPLSKPPPVP